MNEPKQPKNPPPEPDPRATNNNGIPPQADDADAKGTPTDDRKNTETAPET